MLRLALTPEQKLAELRRCREPGDAGFVYFCEHYLWIQDKVAKREVRFELFEGQRRVARVLCAGKWLWILKGRQLGFTWLIAAYTLWRMLHDRMFTAFNFQQTVQYAKDFISRVHFMYDRLPEWMKPRIGKDSELELTLPYRQAGLRALASGRAAARSLTADLGVYDEAAYIEDFDETMAAALPALTGAAQGQIVVLSTSGGPGDLFHTGWQMLTGETELFDESDEQARALEVALKRFEPVFVHWSERPGRDAEWYEEQRVLLSIYGPHHVKREYPNTPAEAFVYSEGRIYPYFHKETHAGVRDEALARRRVRAVDWGGTDAHVCLWIAEFSGPPALIVHPNCRNFIREHLNWRRDPQTKQPIDENNHTCDAFRYAVTTFRLRQTVYVYQERYVRNAAAHGVSELKSIRDIHRMSGWEATPVGDPRPYAPEPGALEISGTVADRSRNDSILLYNSMGLPTIGHRRPAPSKSERKSTPGRVADPKPTEIEEGIMLVEGLIDGTLLMEPGPAASSPTDKVRRLAEQRATLGTNVSPASTDEAVVAWRIREQRKRREQLRRERST